MSRLIGPDEACRVVYITSGANAGKALGAGLAVTICTDATLATPANITDLSGATIVGSVVTVDAYSRLPLFKFPDGVDTVYASVNLGPVVPLYARTDDRLDALAAALAASTNARALDRRTIAARWDLSVDGISALTSSGLTTVSSLIAASVGGTVGQAIMPVWGTRKEFRASFRVTCTKATSGSRSTVGFTVTNPGTLPSGNFIFSVGYKQGLGIGFVRDNVGADVVIVADSAITDGDLYDIGISTDVVFSTRALSPTAIMQVRVTNVSSGTLTNTATSFNISSFPVGNMLISTNVAAGSLANVQLVNHPLGSTGIRTALAPPYSTVSGTETTYLHIPAVPNGKLVLALHGHGSNATETGQTSALYAPTWTALVAAGFIVAAPTMGGDLWGNGVAQAYVVELYNQLIASYDVDPNVFIWGNSMGGGASATLVSDRPFAIRAAYLAQPAVDYDAISANPSFPTINTAYPTSALRDASNPLKRPASTYADVPLVIVASSSDTTINKTTNADALAALTSSATTVRQVTASGNHNDQSMFIARLALDWFRLYV